MRWAIDESGTTVPPVRGLWGRCPGCGGEMVPVITSSGAFMDHWRHRSLDDCVECNRESETGPVLADFLKLKPLKASDVNRRKPTASGRHVSTECGRRPVAASPQKTGNPGRTLVRPDQPGHAPWIDRTSEAIAEAKRWCDINRGRR